jgi:hypothetical protein
MANAKVSFFVSLASQGWSYSFFHAFTGSLRTLFEPGRLLGQSLMGCHTEDVNLDYVRFSDDTIRGDSEVIDLTANGGGGGGTAWPNKGYLRRPTAAANTCIECRLEGGPLNRRSLYLSGVKLEAVTAVKPWVLFGDQLLAIADLRMALTTQGWTFKSVNSVGLFFGIESAVPTFGTPGVQWTLTMSGIIVMAVGTKIKISGVVPRGNGLSGYYYVLSKTDVGGKTILTIGGGQAPRVAGWIYLGGGEIVLTSASFIAFTDLVARRPGERKRGRPFGQRAGRTRSRGPIL